MLTNLDIINWQRAELLLHAHTLHKQNLETVACGLPTRESSDGGSDRRGHAVAAWYVARARTQLCLVGDAVSHDRKCVTSVEVHQYSSACQRTEMLSGPGPGQRKASCTCSASPRCAAQSTSTASADVGSLVRCCGGWVSSSKTCLAECTAHTATRLLLLSVGASANADATSTD